jgi:signal transduction histidine kinase
MQVEKLRAAVAELERQMSTSPSLDDASRQVLQQALADIRAALEDNQTTDSQRQSLIQRLGVSVEKFEGSHPTLTGTLMRLIDGLQQLGI